MMHFHEDHPEFQGKTPKQVEDSVRMILYCAFAIGIIGLALFGCWILSI